MYCLLLGLLLSLLLLLPKRYFLAYKIFWVQNNDQVCFLLFNYICFVLLWFRIKKNLQLLSVLCKYFKNLKQLFHKA